MTQTALADLFQTSRNNITMHVQNIYKEGELMEEATSKPDLLVRNEGSRTVKRTIKLEVYQFICPKAKEANKCALKNTHSSKERKWFGTACSSIVFAYSLSGLIARSWSTEAQGNIPAFSFYGTEREEDMEHLRRRRRGFWAARSPFCPIDRRFRVPWPIRGSQN